MNNSDTLSFEIKLLLEAILFRYGHDFRNYAQASLERRVLNRMMLSNLNTVAEMIPLILHSDDFFNLFLKDMSITVTDMYRNPHVFAKIRCCVFTQLNTYSRINIWHAGCATGEEVYSMAIMLKEEGLLHRTRIYATDFNGHSLDIAQKGIYSVDKVKQFEQNYLHAGGKTSLSDYYHAKHNYIKIDDSLKKSITFANHNLVNDLSFAQMHMIVCRNVLIYFNNNLQNKVLGLFMDSLIHKGFLVLGDKESLDFSDIGHSFDEYEKLERIYQRRDFG